jgi:mono/diheme cytochrome c family protein
LKHLVFLLALGCVPVAAQDAQRGKLLYETHCGGCHYERVHQRDRANSRVKSLAELRDEVVRRAQATGRPFALEDLEDLAAYLNRSHYRFGEPSSGRRELIYGAGPKSEAERGQ